MNKKHLIILSKILIAILLMTSMIVMSDTCLTGAKNGLLLWFNTLLPTLFPFFVISRLIIELDMCPRSLYKIYPIFIGLIAGYPTGAVTVSDMKTKGIITAPAAQGLLIICNNASPAFLISYAATSCLGINEYKYLIWISVISACLITYALYHFLMTRTHSRKSFDPNSRPNDNNSTAAINNNSTDTNYDSNILTILEDTIMASFKVLIMIGGYVILFSILAAMLAELCATGIISGINISALTGILEITTGCGNIAILPETVPIYIKSTAIAVLCGFGGICALLQTGSAIKASGLSIRSYMIHKLICGILSGIICCIILHYM